MKQLQFFLFAAALLVAVPPAGAATLTLWPVDDTFLLNGVPTEDVGAEPFGNATTLLFGNRADVSYNAFPLVRFDLSALAGSTVVGPATFSIAYNGGDDVVHTVALVILPEPFVGASTTFENYNVTAPATARVGTALIDGSTRTFETEGGYFDFVLPSALIQFWIDHPSQNFGIGLFLAADAESLSFDSAESARPPLLTFTVVPEPTFTAVAMVGGLLGLVLLRRSRKRDG